MWEGKTGEKGKGAANEGEKKKKTALETKAQRVVHKGNIVRSGCEKVALCKKMWYNGGMDAEEAKRKLTEGETGEKFALFYELLTFYNEKFNLTRITGREECYKKHFFDSLTGEEFFPQGAACAEIGSGAGFPSVPLLIVREDLRFDLFESSHKKCAFLCEVVDKLGLRANVHALRAEDAGKDAAFREAFDVCTARAVARLATLAEYCAPFVRVGGRFVAYKGKAEEELAEAEGAFGVLGLRLECTKKLFLEREEDERTLLCVKKVRATPAAYPRGKGKERSAPLGVRGKKPC